MHKKSLIDLYIFFISSIRSQSPQEFFQVKMELTPSPGPCDSNILSTPRTFRRMHIPSLAGTEIAKKILTLRDLLTHGADCRPLEVLEDLCRYSPAVQPPYFCYLSC